MTVDRIRTLLRAEPFQPFSLRLVDRHQVRVPRPEWAMVSPDGRTMVMFDAANAFHMFNVADIASVLLELPPPEPDAIVGH